jgi:hypothetical protein
VTSGDVLAGQSENFARKLRDVVIPSNKRLDGFAGALALLDRENAKGTVVIFWESRAASEQRMTPTADMDNLRKVQESVVCDVVANHSAGAWRWPAIGCHGIHTSAGSSASRAVVVPVSRGQMA